MITITIKMKSDVYMPKIDRLFIEATHMDKVDEGRYESDQDVMRDCYLSAKELMRNQWFRDNVISMKWKVGKEPEDDMVAFFNERINKYGELY